MHTCSSPPLQKLPWLPNRNQSPLCLSIKPHPLPVTLTLISPPFSQHTPSLSLSLSWGSERKDLSVAWQYLLLWLHNIYLGSVQFLGSNLSCSCHFSQPKVEGKSVCCREFTFLQSWERVESHPPPHHMLLCFFAESSRWPLFSSLLRAFNKINKFKTKKNKFYSLFIFGPTLAF